MFRMRTLPAKQWYQFDVFEGFIFKFTGGGKHPLGKTCYKNGLVRRGLNYCNLRYNEKQKIVSLTVTCLEMNLTTGQI